MKLFQSQSFDCSAYSAQGRRNSAILMTTPAGDDVTTPVHSVLQRKNSMDITGIRRLSTLQASDALQSPCTDIKPFSHLVDATLAASVQTPSLRDLRNKSPFCCSLDRNSPIVSIGTPNIPMMPSPLERQRILSPFQSTRSQTPVTRESFQRLQPDPRRITLTGLLGSGGFGSVYKGTFCGKQIAVKKFHSNQRNIKARAQSFQAESNTQHLSHPNVVSVLASFSENLFDQSYIIMEYAGHMNLQQLINQSEGSIPQGKRLAYSLDISQALNYIHGQKFVHLDVKPGNIIIGSGDVCRLADFGCCQVLSHADEGQTSPTCRSYLTGTVAYRAPELLRGEAPCAKADIYSFGVTLWQMLTCETPFFGENAHVVIFGVVSQNMRPSLPTKFDPIDEVEKAYKDCFEQCWASVRSMRPSADELINRFKSMRQNRHSKRTAPG